MRGYEQFWQKCLEEKPTHLEEPQLPRRRPIPKRLENPCDIIQFYRTLETCISREIMWICCDCCEHHHFKTRKDTIILSGQFGYRQV
ncbi:hypothetical protein PR048_012676 [Dryococelus australis]|uniref:Uncharacterized protein n=1 Tax=Dryococelus australis TaxID=614101 RepID=A0ABQ9HQN8_9NEOP|nr:hypothetical protein PR048_012676 [Dryococelus australis]